MLHSEEVRRLPEDKKATHGSKSVSSINSGSYDPGPVAQDETSSARLNTAELSTVQAQQNDILLEEFPEGPYGAATDQPATGKSTPWTPGQQSVSAFRDANPVDSNRKVAIHEPARDAPKNTVEAEN